MFSDFIFRRTLSDAIEDDILFFDQCIQKIIAIDDGLDSRYIRATQLDRIFIEKEINTAREKGIKIVEVKGEINVLFNGGK